MTEQPKSKMFELMQLASPGGLKWLQAMTYADDWALAIGISVDGHPFTYDGRPYLRDIIRDNSPLRVIRKSAQGGATVISQITAMHWWVQRRWNVMYLLPIKNGTIPFSQGRIEPLIASAPYLASRVESVDNINHKRTANANFYVRGTNIPTELQEVPIDAMIWDEYDKMRMKNMKLARTRMHASPHKWRMILSTPTIPGYGIDREYLNSDQREWWLKCPKCGIDQTLGWETNVRIGDDHLGRDSVMECSHCHKVWKHEDILQASEDTGHWVITRPDLSDHAHGFYFNQLFSPTRSVSDLVEEWYEGQEDPEALRELYNSALGLPFTVAGDKITEEILDACRIEGYKMPGIHADYTGRHVAIGVDVGKVLHVVGETKDETGRRVKVFTETMTWEQLEQLCHHIKSFTLVIDRFPETNKAQALSYMFHGRVFLCQYQRIPEMARWKYPADETEVGEVKADRTMSLDRNVANYMSKNVILPEDARDMGERKPDKPYNGFYAMMMSQVRMQKPDDNNNMKAMYEKVDGPDHWHHADNYCTLAGLFEMPPEPPRPGPEMRTGPDAGFHGGFDDFVLGDFNVDSLGDY